MVRDTLSRRENGNEALGRKQSVKWSLGAQERPRWREIPKTQKPPSATKRNQVDAICRKYREQMEKLARLVLIARSCSLETINYQKPRPKTGNCCRPFGIT